jgi:hypothetical protein
MNVDLLPFCGASPKRAYFARPVTAGEFTYATDGVIILRVPRGDAEPTKDLPEIALEKPFEGIEAAGFEPLLTKRKLPAAPEPKKVECYACEGSKTEHGCPNCTCPCERCGGTGEVTDIDEKVSTTVRGVTFDLRYVLLMLSLPGVEVATKADKDKPLLFRFDGGIGALMPMRNKTDKHTEIETKRVAA